MLSTYYTELLQRDEPFVPHKFRSKITRSTEEFEKENLKDSVIYSMNNQIKTMDHHVNKWKEELTKIEEDVNEILATVSETKRKEFIDKSANDDEQNKRERTNSYDKLKKTYEEEMNAADADADLFLLTYAEKDTSYNNKNNKHNNSSKNLCGRFLQRGRGRKWREN